MSLPTCHEILKDINEMLKQYPSRGINEEYEMTRCVASILYQQLGYVPDFSIVGNKSKYFIVEFTE